MLCSHSVRSCAPNLLLSYHLYSCLCIVLADVVVTLYCLLHAQTTVITMYLPIVLAVMHLCLSMFSHHSSSSVSQKLKPLKSKSNIHRKCTSLLPHATLRCLLMRHSTTRLLFLRAHVKNRQVDHKPCSHMSYFSNGVPQYNIKFNSKEQSLTQNGKLLDNVNVGGVRQ